MPALQIVEILDAWANQAAWTEAPQAWAEHAYTLRELAAALHRAGLARCRLAAILNRPAHCGRESGNRCTRQTLEIWPNDPEPRGAERAAEIDRVNEVVLASAAAHELSRWSPRPKRMQ